MKKYALGTLMCLLFAAPAHANEGVGFILLQALTRVEPQPGFIQLCTNYKKNTAFSVVYFPSSSNTSVFLATGETYQSCKPVFDKKQILKRSASVKSEVEQAIQMVNERRGLRDDISIEVLFPVSHKSIKPTFVERLMSLLSMDAYAHDSDPAAMIAEVHVRHHTSERIETIDRFPLPE